MRSKVEKLKTRTLRIARSRCTTPGPGLGLRDVGVAQALTVDPGAHSCHSGITELRRVCWSKIKTFFSPGREQTQQQSTKPSQRERPRASSTHSTLARHGTACSRSTSTGRTRAPGTCRHHAWQLRFSVVEARLAPVWGGQRQRRANGRLVPPSVVECWFGPRAGLAPCWLRRTPV